MNICIICNSKPAKIKYCAECRPSAYYANQAKITKRWAENNPDKIKAIRRKNQSKSCSQCGATRQRKDNTPFICNKCKTDNRIKSLPPKRNWRPGNDYVDKDEFSSFVRPLREDWAPVPDFDVYVINSQGVIRDTRTGNLRAWNSHPKGYAVITLHQGGVQKAFTIHSLVAKVFLPAKPTNAHQINHKDLQKRNNNAENLEWATNRENTQHYYDNRDKK